ncbi:MAG: dihydrolipoamide acetyltransferase family protein [Planctomycetota bacterium]
MPIEITMPRLSDTMEEGTLVRWLVKPGDTVSASDHIADVETDKATMELNVFDEGTVAKLAIDEGGTVPVGSLIAVLAEDGESVDDAAKAAGSGGGASSNGAAKAETEAPTETAPAAAAPTAPAAPAATGGGKLKVSPLARKMAETAGLDLSQIAGSGPDGRIIKRDILAAQEGGATAKPAAAPTPSRPAAPVAPIAAGPSALEAKTVQVSGIRKTIAKRLVESKTTVPHFQVSVAVDMDPLMGLRKTINGQLESQGVKLSVNDFVTRAVALACLEHPVVNASWTGDSVVYHGAVNVGIAIALPIHDDGSGGGLLVATVRDVERKGLRAISSDVKALAGKARKSGLTPDEMSDSTITISNLGMPQYGVTQFTAIVNPPNAAIIAVGAALQKPVVRNGEIVVGHEMNVTLSGDHRVIDGAVAAEYLSTLRRLLENPAALLV